MIHRIRATTLTLAALLSFGIVAPGAARAQQPAAPAAGAPAPGPRVAPMMRPAEPVEQSSESASFAPTYKKKDTTVISISTVGLIVVLILLIILIG